MLYIVPTPIGNLEDITLRAIRILKEVDLVLAEDTRTSGRLLKEYDIETPMSSFHAFNEHKSLDRYLQMLREGNDLALISDAGTPGISDPGFLLVRSAITEEQEVTVLPGPTAMIPAVVVSGLPCDRFHFEGFLPHKKGRKTKWESLSEKDCTIILYESPHRINKCIHEVVEYCGGDRPCAVIREISKKFEEVIRGTAQEVMDKLENRTLKGEIVVCIGGKNK